MNNCNQPCGCNHGAGVCPGPCVSRNCGKQKSDLRIKTELLPASVGTDEKGQPYAPKLGRYFNTVVQYAANDATYIYDSQGIYTKMNSTMTVDDALAVLKQQIASLQTKEQSDVDNLQENINQLANKEAEDVEDLQANINEEVERAEKAEADLSKGLNDENSRAYEAEQELQQKVENVEGQLGVKQDTLVSGTNIKTINGESVLGEGDMTIAGGGADYLYQYTLSADNLNQLLYNVTTDSSVVIRGNVVEKGDEESGANIPLTTLPVATSLKAGVMSAADKAKLDSLSGGGGSTPENLTWVFGGNDDTPKQVSIINATFNTAPSLGLSIPYFDYTDNEVKTGNIDVFPFATTDRAGLMSASDKTKLDGLSASTNLTSVPTASYTADNVNLAFGDDTVELTPAVGTAGGANSKAGIMSAFQASQLAALAEAYKDTTQGITLYEGTASVNYIDLSDNAWNYDHIVVVGEYISAGSASFHQSVSAEFYPNSADGINTFQLNAIDIVANDTPVQTTLQDIWMLDEEGTELSLVAGMKSSITGGETTTLTVEPESTSIFTITKVVGYGKKV